MKISIIIYFITGTFLFGCGSPSLSIKETNEKELEDQILLYQKEEAAGTEVTLLLSEGGKISGELLSVRDSSITLCEKYSATEEELAGLKYPISNIETNSIIELEIEGNTYPLWIGAGISLVAGTITMLLVKDDLNIHIGSASEEKKDKAVGSCCLAVGITLLPVAIGRMLSTEDLTLSDIPAGYKFFPLRSLARYTDKEPDYLKAIE